MKYFDEVALYLSSPYEHPERYEPWEQQESRSPGYYGINEKEGEYVPFDEAAEYVLEMVQLIPKGRYSQLQNDAIEVITDWYFSDLKKWEKVDE